MTKVFFQQAVSLDGYSAGPNQRSEEPLGDGGEALHTWAMNLDSWRQSHGLEGGEHSPSSAVMDETTANVGACIMGRNMFGGGPGPWDGETWQGWWGDNPPFQTPVFVLTHYQRAPLRMGGGTTFHFVTEGPEHALEQARAAAGDKDIRIAGGAQTIQQFLRLGAVDEFWLDEAPIILGGGTRLMDDIPLLDLRQVKAVAGNGVTHIKYEVVR